MRIVTLATGVGNVRSVLRALDRATHGVAGKEILMSSEAAVVRSADVLVVPGQGSFGAFAATVQGELREALLEKIRSGTPYLGICLGLQILFEEGDEAPGTKGLGVLRGRVRRLEPGVDAEAGRPYALPHIGWNRAELVRGDAQAGIVAPGHYYFAHSYAAVPEDPTVVLTTTSYGDSTFASAVQKDRVVGVQFHPEKSQSMGLALIERFFASLERSTG